MKNKILLSTALILGFGASCSGCSSSENIISICASQTPHAEILNQAVKPLLEEKGYTLEVTILDWTIQNDAVKNSDYDANYFQHRPYLQQYDSGSAVYKEDYSYSKVFPTAAVHFEPLRIYSGKSAAADFETKKALTTTTYEICADVSNEIRALDLLKANGIIQDYETDKDGTPINLPSNITLIDENLLVASRSDYDYALLPCNTALTGNLTADASLPCEDETVSSLRANVIAANVSKYSNDEEYKKKIDALTDAVLQTSVSQYITSAYKGVIEPVIQDLR
ncbi:MAG: MetQ/NlpA family ABC transporter substrate-binding protein [Bacilli bacterium]